MAHKKTFASLIASRNVLMILLLSFVVVAIWVGFSIYFSYTKTTLTPVDNALILPLTPKLSTTLFDDLTARKSWTDDELENFAITNNVIVQTPTPAVVASGSGKRK